MPSWKERRDRLANRTKESVDNRESGSTRILQYDGLPEDQEPKWIDKPKKARQGNNEYDFLPFIISEDWYYKMLTFSGSRNGGEVGMVDYKLEYYRHVNIGPEKADILCLAKTFGEPCYICEAREHLMENAEDEDPKGDLAEALKPKCRVLYNVIDLNADDDEVRLWDMSYFLFEKMLLTEVQLGDDGLLIFWDLDEGQTVVWRGEEKKIGKRGHPFIQCDRVDFKDRDPYPESILEEVFPLDKMLRIPSYDDQVRALTGMPLDNEQDNVQEEKEEVKKEKTSSRQRNRGSNKEDKKAQENPCSEGHNFGEDFDDHPDCENCSDEDYDACEIANLEKAADKEEVEKEAKAKAEKEAETEAEKNTTKKRRGRNKSSSTTNEEGDNKTTRTRKKRR